ncbi:MAG: F0F1 ATP synthase subunit B [Thermomicrobiales bacterium]|nr:F0F1 ATP synthase subunit B [Thermomicrobiales bacterium]MCO5219381.1 F0F1 ATP synthase subunit B [Thermomicrobiales bacterium]MCO5225231.1 F0F1 ATP synthase subunit B [Thermomicrobiales bacterium]MCO5227052.1 F0F1 ATP synthase subunit B [Thermomicrobiales bacterium]
MGDLGINGWNFIVQVIAFLVFVYLLWRYAVGPIVKVLDTRQDKISESLMAAERMQQELRDSAAKNEEIMAQARREAQELLNAARGNAEQIVNRANEQAATSADEFLSRAQETLRQETAQARQQLRMEVADLAVNAAGKILRKEISADDQRTLIEQTLNESR